LSHSLDTEIDRLREILWSARDPQGRAFASLADAYRRRGDLPLARTMVLEGLERLPDFSGGHVVAGWIHREMGSPVEADRSFRRVLELDPENAMALRALGELAEERGSHAEAAEFFRRLSAVDPDGGSAPGEREAGRAEGPELGEVLRGTMTAWGIESAEVADSVTRGPDPMDDAEEEARQHAAVPVESLSPDAPLDGEPLEAPASGLDVHPGPMGADDADRQDEDSVSIVDLAPDDGSFDFAVADLGDEPGSDSTGALEVGPDEAAAGWGLDDDPEAVPADSSVDEVTAADSGPEAPAALGWSWSPPVDDPPDRTQSKEMDAQEAPPPPESVDVEEPGSSGPAPAAAVPIASLAPDPESAAPTSELHRRPPSQPVDRPASAAGAGEVEGPPDDAVGEDDEDGMDDFQAWLERNSI